MPVVHFFRLRQVKRCRIAQGFASGFIVVSAEEERQSLKYQTGAQRIQ